MLGDSLKLKRHGADVAVSAVSSSSIVVDLDILEDSPPRLFPGDKALAVDDFDLQGMEEALGTSIVVTVAFGAHAAHQGVFLQQALVGRGTVLRPTVGVDEYAHGQRAITDLTDWPFTQGCVDREIAVSP